MHFQVSLSLGELQVIKDWLCVRDIAETSFNRFVAVAYLKKQSLEFFCRKRRSLKFYRKALVLRSLFNKEHVFLRTPVPSCNFIYNAEAVVQRCSVKKVFLEILQKLQESFSARSATLLKKRLWHRCFPVTSAKFLKTPFY